MANENTTTTKLNSIDNAISDLLALTASISIKLNVDISNGADEYGNDLTSAHIRVIRDDLPIQADKLKSVQEKIKQLKNAIQ